MYERTIFMRYPHYTYHNIILIQCMMTSSGALLFEFTDEKYTEMYMLALVCKTITLIQNPVTVMYCLY